MNKLSYQHHLSTSMWHIARAIQATSQGFPSSIRTDFITVLLFLCQNHHQQLASVVVARHDRLISPHPFQVAPFQDAGRHQEAYPCTLEEEAIVQQLVEASRASSAWDLLAVSMVARPLRHQRREAYQAAHQEAYQAAHRTAHQSG